MLPVPKFPLGRNAIIASLILFPIGIFVLYFATIIYLARWMCYNFQLESNILCYIIAFILSPIFLPLLIISFIVREMNRSKKEKSDDYYPLGEEEVKRTSPKRTSPKRTSPKRTSPKRK